MFARIGGTPFASYWCLRCYDCWRSSGKVRPGIVIRRNSVPKPDACATCNLPAAEVRGWLWFDDVQTWNCQGCYSDRREKAIRSRERASIPKPDRCPHCRRKPSQFNNKWLFNRKTMAWWCQSCRNKLAIREAKEKMFKTLKPEQCPECHSTEAKKITR